MAETTDPVGWAAKKPSIRERWPWWRPNGFLDQLIAVLVFLLAVGGLGVIFTPEVWMPDSILKPEFRSHHTGSLSND